VRVLLRRGSQGNTETRKRHFDLTHRDFLLLVAPV
jgi:hypothetical protein